MALDIAHGHISKIVPDNDSNHSPQTVFYYDGENDAEDYTNIFGNHAIGTKNLHIIRKFYFRDVKEWLKDVRKKLKGVRGDATVILDNISCILSTFNANIIRELFLRDFTKIQSDFAPSKVTFIVVAHTNKEKEFEDILDRYPGKVVIDLVRQWNEVDYDGHYEGLSWGDINRNTAAQQKEIEKDFRQTDF